MSNISIKREQASTIIIGALYEMLNNAKYAYVSMSNPKFSRLEDDGKAFVVSLVESVLPLLVEARSDQIKQDAEEMMLNKLGK